MRQKPWLGATRAVSGGNSSQPINNPIGKARAATAARKDATALLSNDADRYRDELDVWINDQAFGLTDLLCAKLDDRLDRSEEVTDALGEVRTADDAVDAGLAAEWK